MHQERTRHRCCSRRALRPPTPSRQGFTDGRNSAGKTVAIAELPALLDKLFTTPQQQPPPAADDEGLESLLSGAGSFCSVLHALLSRLRSLGLEAKKAVELQFAPLLMQRIREVEGLALRVVNLRRARAAEV